MKKLLYRVVFNRVRGMRTVVRETDSSSGKEVHRAAGGSGVAMPRPLTRAAVHVIVKSVFDVRDTLGRVSIISTASIYRHAQDDQRHRAIEAGLA